MMAQPIINCLFALLDMAKQVQHISKLDKQDFLQDKTFITVKQDNKMVTI